jgi:hypothetical protein
MILVPKASVTTKLTIIQFGSNDRNLLFASAGDIAHSLEEIIRRFDRNRRISPVAAHSGDRLLSEPQPALSLVGGNRSSCPISAVHRSD